MACPARIGILIAIAAALCLAGCAGRSRNAVRIGDVTLEQFKAGVTSEAWVRAILGPPSSQSEVVGVPNTHVLRYALERRKSGFLSFLTGSSSELSSVVYFIVTDGTVTRFWADRAVEHTLLGSPVEQSGAKVEP